MSTLLEDRYRHLLRMLPVSYRAGREEEMVAVYLESTGDSEEEQLGRPHPSEALSIAALAVRVRLGGAGASARSLAWGRTLRLVALLGLMAQTAMAVAGLMVDLRIRLQGDGQQVTPLATPAGVLEFAVPVAWTAAFVMLVLGRRGVTRALVALLVVQNLVPLFGGIRLEAALSGWSAGLSELAGSSLLLIPALALAAFHRDAPPLDRRWLLAPVALLALLALPWLATGWIVFDPFVVALVAGAVVHGVRSRRAPRTPEVPLALAILGVPLLGLQIVLAGTLLAMQAAADPNLGGLPYPALGVVEAAVLAVVVPLCLAAGLRALRALPVPPLAGPAPVSSST